MSNDTTYHLQMRHPTKACLEEVRIYLTVVKPAICRFFQNMNFDPEWTEKQSLNFLGIRNLNEVVTWFGPRLCAMIEPNVTRVKKDGNSYLFEISTWANENASNVPISCRHGELADLLKRFPELEICGEYVDEYGAGSVSGYAKIQEMTRLEYQIQDESNWEEEECAHYSDATKELLMKAYCGDLDLPGLRRLLKEGADVNAVWNEATFLSIMVPPCGDLAEPGAFAEAVKLILKSGWRYNPQDPHIHEALVRMADNLRGVESARPARLKMAETLLARKPAKDVDAGRLFQDGLKARDVRGLLASAFLGANFDAEAAKVSKAARAWLKRQRIWEEPEE
jgi:hypothetical protein